MTSGGPTMSCQRKSFKCSSGFSGIKFEKLGTQILTLGGVKG